MSKLTRRQAITGGTAAGIAAALPATAEVRATGTEDLTALGRLTVEWMAADAEWRAAARATQGAFGPAARGQWRQGPAYETYEAKVRWRLFWGERMTELEEQVRTMALRLRS